MIFSLSASAASASTYFLLSTFFSKSRLWTKKIQSNKAAVYNENTFKYLIRIAINTCSFSRTSNDCGIMTSECYAPFGRKRYSEVMIPQSLLIIEKEQVMNA